VKRERESKFNVRKCVAVVVVRVDSGDNETALGSLLVPPFGLLGEYVSSQILGETYAKDLQEGDTNGDTSN